MPRTTPDADFHDKWAKILAFIGAVTLVSFALTGAPNLTPQQSASKLAATPGFGLNQAINSMVVLNMIWQGEASLTNADGSSRIVELTAQGQCTGSFFSRDGDNTSDGELLTASHCTHESLGAYSLRNELIDAIFDQMYEANPTAGFYMFDSSDLPEVENIRLTVMADQPKDDESESNYWPGIKPVLNGPTEAYVVKQDDPDFRDMSLLKIHGLQNVPALNIAAETPAIQTEVLAIGFPGAYVSMATDYRPDGRETEQRMIDAIDTGQLRATAKNGTVNSLQETELGMPFIDHDAATGKGMSGGMLVNKHTLEVLGVIFATADTQNFNMATDTGQLNEFLGTNMSNTMEPQDNNTSTATNYGSLDKQTYWKLAMTVTSMLLLVLSACLLVTFLGGLIVSSIKKRRQRSQPASLPSVSIQPTLKPGSKPLPVRSAPLATATATRHPAARIAADLARRLLRR